MKKLKTKLKNGMACALDFVQKLIDHRNLRKELHSNWETGRKGESAMNKKRSIYGRCLLGALFGFLTIHAQAHLSFGFLPDMDSHAPPSSGTYIYSPPGMFMPNNLGFPSAGGSYTDPVFGETVKRITNVYNSSRRHVSYSAKPVINADNTMCFLEGASGDFHIYSLSGSLLRSDGNWQSPYIENWQWHPTNPDKLLIMTSSALHEYTYSTNSSAQVVSFGSGLHNGGTAEFTDQTGRYYLGLVSGTVRFYDRNSQTFYSNQPTVSGTDYVIMAADGSGALVIAGGGSRWYSVNHSNKSWNTGYNTICNGTPHGDLATDSNGVTWFIADGMPITSIGGKAVSNIATVYKIPVENPLNWVSLFHHNRWELPIHVSGNVKGSNRDWVAISFYGKTGNITDPAPWNSWIPFKDEIVLVNLNTGALRRLLHCRTRGDNYYQYPKGSLSLDGSLVIFNSNMGRQSGTYVDAYTVTTGLKGGSNTAGDGVLSRPGNPRIVQ